MLEMAKPQIVNVSLNVTVDPEAWTATYGVAGTEAIRDDVRAYILTLVQRSPAGDECDLTAKLR
jgi:hypothetical protein